jgi:hypothetical protein
LQEAKSLRQIFVQGTKVTPEGIERFRKAFPQCQVQP